MIGRHNTSKSKKDPTFSAQWSGVSYAPHAPYCHSKCSFQLHDEDGNMYCPWCDDYVGDVDLAEYYLQEGKIYRVEEE